MKYHLPSSQSIERRLIFAAAGSLFLLAVILSLSPAARDRSWSVEYRVSHWFGFVIWFAMTFLIHSRLRKNLPDTDPYLLPIISLLSGLGIIFIWRLAPPFGLRQTAWFAIGAVVLILGAKYFMFITLLKRYKYVLLLGGLLLTSLTLIFGTNPLGDGPRLWLGCCGVYLQPSEPLKLLLVIYLSAYFADNLPFRQGFFPLILPTLLLTGLALLILIVQRDLGTASIFIFLYAVILYLATGRMRVILASLLILVMAAMVGYFIVDIIQIRLIAWLNPWSDPSGSGYQTIQSLLAISNGGLPGRGIGVGYPGLVPVAISDFIFSAMAEEMGLIGTVLLFCLLAVVIARGIHTALKAQDTFRRLLSAGLTAYLGAQSILIIGGNLRLLPLTGVTLPFISYGGSSLLTSMIATLLILIVGSQPEDDPAPLQNPMPYLHLAFLFFALLFGLALTNSWWSLWRADDLLVRTDNPRRSISDAYVPRGDLVDRTLKPINITTGESGSFSRQYKYPDLSAIAGYTNTIFGQSGLELSLDPYLRGYQGNPVIQTWWNRLLYGTPPPGSTVRLSIDLSLQKRADDLLRGYKGSAILLNAKTGEILALASHPTFDPNALSETGAELVNDPDAPLLNRATQGSYPVDSVLSLFTRVAGLERSIQPSRQDLIDIFSKLGFYSEPEIDLPVAPASQFGEVENLKLSPLQVALAATSLANEGVWTPGQLVSAVQSKNTGWIVLSPSVNAIPIFDPAIIKFFSAETTVPKQPYWRIANTEGSADSSVTWFIGGTPFEWNGTPLIAVIALENGDTAAANFIGQELLMSALDK